MPERSIEMMVTFVIKVPAEVLAQAMAQALLDEFEDWLEAGPHPFFLNRCSQKDGRKVTLRMDYKRPPNV